MSTATVAAIRDRARRDTVLWAALALVVAATVAFVAWALHVLVGTPDAVAPWAAGALGLLPIGVILGRVTRTQRWAGRVFGPSLILCGLVVMVLGVYLVVVVGLGGDVESEGHGLLALSMVAALTAVVLAEPTRARLRELATRWAGAQPKPPASVLETFGARMTRAVPMDELLLQLAETLHETLGPIRAEVWSGTGGVLDRVVSVPERGAARLRLDGPELTAVSSARVSGNAWAAVWLPTLLADLTGRPAVGAGAGTGAGVGAGVGAAAPGTPPAVRIATATHLGELLGMIVVVRGADQPQYGDEDDRVLTELGRQVGLALHNVRLDSALQASLEELRERNAELQASRARIVNAADASRRQIERNLHDGAQQHLVALAVKLGLARKVAEADPSALPGMLEDLRADAQATLVELRELAHGIYPPLLRDHGLAEALGNAASRAVLPTTVVVDAERRYAPDIEAAVYFCCLEALQNAGKHAGDDAEVTIRVHEDGATLTFEVADDGAGFDAVTAANGHGFVNMRDRVGAVGGAMTVDARPGQGVTVRGTLPAVVARTS